MKKANRLIYHSTVDRIFDLVLYGVAFLLIVCTLYPILYTLALSFSGRVAVESGKVWLFPVDFSWSSYELLARHPQFLQSYVNTILYTITGTAYSLFLTALGGYVLSRKEMEGQKAFLLLITFTMLFSGGLIPTFIVVNRLGLHDNPLAMILPCAISVWNLIVVRTSMMMVPVSLEESAKIDGANHWQIFLRIFLPVSKPVLATIGLFYAVGKWNDFFTPLIYLNNSKLFPVQLVIRGLLTGLDNLNSMGNLTSGTGVSGFTPVSFKSAVIVITMLPILCVYPFIQKYFVKGVMLGAIKG